MLCRRHKKILISKAFYLPRRRDHSKDPIKEDLYRQGGEMAQLKRDLLRSEQLRKSVYRGTLGLEKKKKTQSGSHHLDVFYLLFSENNIFLMTRKLKKNTPPPANGRIISTGYYHVYTCEHVARIKIRATHGMRNPLHVQNLISSRKERVVLDGRAWVLQGGGGCSVFTMSGERESIRAEIIRPNY